MTVYHRSLTAAGTLIVGIWVLASLFASQLAPYDPYESILPFTSPGAAAPDGGTFWFGTDFLGRDTFSRVMFAARNIISLVGLTVFLAYLLGLPTALVATGKNRLWQKLAGALIVLGRAVPVLITYLVLRIAFGPPHFGSFAVAFFLASLPGVRDEVTILRESLRMSAPDRPAPGQVIVYFSVALLKRIAFYIAIAECIAVVGLGPFLPPGATFGGMVTETRQMLWVFPSMVFIPIAVLIVLLLGLNALASGLEGLLPASLRKVDPATPSFRLGSRRHHLE